MRRPVVRIDEMRYRRRREAELDELMDPQRGSANDPFARFASDLRLAFPEQAPSTDARKQHVMAILSRVAETSPRLSTTPAKRSLRALLLAARLAGSAALLSGALTAAAFADILPEDLHSVVARFTSIFGIDIPDKEHGSDPTGSDGRDHGDRGDAPGSAPSEDGSNDGPGSGNGGEPDDPGEGISGDGDDSGSEDGDGETDDSGDEGDENDDPGSGAGDDADDDSDEDPGDEEDENDDPGSGAGDDADDDSDDDPGDEEDETDDPGSGAGDPDQGGGSDEDDFDPIDDDVEAGPDDPTEPYEEVEPAEPQEFLAT